MKNLLIPRSVLFSDPQRTQVKLSPQGRYISFLSPYQGILNLWLAPLADPQEAKPITQVNQPIKNYEWSATEDYLLFLLDNQGDENWQLHSIEIANLTVREHTPKGLQAQIIQTSTKMPHHVLIALNERDRNYHDVYRLDLLSNQKECLYQNNRFWHFIGTEDLEVKVAIEVQGKQGAYWDITVPNAPKMLVQVSQLDLLNIYFYSQLKLDLGAQEYKTKLYLTNSWESNTSSLICVEMNTQQITVLANDPQADIQDVLVHPLFKSPIAYAVNYKRKKWYCLEKEYQEDFETLSSLETGDMNILSQDHQQDHWLVEFVYADQASRFYHYNRRDKKATYLFASDDQLKDHQLSQMYPVVITTRDGLDCVSYLSLPPQQDLNHNGKPDKPLPLVLWVHGGPNFRDFWGFSAIHQWLANRGYAVLSVNYRGSTGFGKAHTSAGNGEWGGKIQTDLLDAVQWACKAGIADPQKVAIMGRSFGGYATLMALSTTPEVFCCGVDIVGPANLNTLVKNFPPYWRAMQSAVHDMLGCDPTTSEGEAYLTQRSPLTYAHQITRPLLIAHGANDVQATQVESDQMVEAMQEEGIPVTYIVFPDEGHQFMRPSNRLAFYALAEAFLAKNLGGLNEAIDPALGIERFLRKDDFQFLKA